MLVKGEFSKFRLSEKSRMKLAAVSWLCNPVNVEWYYPPAPKRGTTYTGTHSPFPMYWTQYYPQLRKLVSKLCHVTIPAQSWLPIMKLVVTNLDFGGERPFYTENTDNWMVGSGKDWSEEFINQLHTLIKSKDPDKPHINSSTYSAELQPSFPTFTRTTGIEYDFGL